jgi:hypothetical protein
MVGLVGFNAKRAVLEVDLTPAETFSIATTNAFAMQDAIEQPAINRYRGLSQQRSVFVGEQDWVGKLTVSLTKHSEFGSMVNRRERV